MTSFLYQPPAHAGLEILYLDDAVLAVNKPAGLLSVPGRGEDKADCMVARAQAEYPDALTVHRLDMDTSGILIFGRGKEAQRNLSMAFERRDTAKRYIALVDGRLEGEGEVDLPLMVDWPNRPKKKIDFEQGKPSQTLYKALEYDAERDVTRVELTPITGRSHQLRMHMLALDHVIIGDTLYAHPIALAKSARLCLHAASLAIPHPVTGTTLELSCPTPF